MKRTKGKSGFSLFGALMFFALIAAVIQISVLVYDYIIQRTSDKGLIAVLMLMVIFILAAVCTVCDFVRRQIMVDRPVSQILRATERIASGDFSVRLAVLHRYDKYNEYDLIMENINLLAEALGKSEMLGGDFVSNVSHEIKTPLAVISNCAEMLDKGGLDAETETKYKKSILGASRRLAALVTNVLKLNKLENQSLRPEYSSFNLTGEISEILVSYEDAIERKNITLECELDDVTVYSAESYLELVWNNLISNAVKFTEEGGRISVSLKSQGRNVIFKIRDTGCGISQETGARIFEKFYQGDTSHSSEGNGLGLALVKRVIDTLGGEISVESELGRGSEFTIVLKDARNEG